MNKKQKIARWIGLAFFLIVTFVPLHAKRPFGGIKGYEPSPPLKVTYHQIQTPQLYKYWIVIAVVTGALIISLKESK